MSARNHFVALDGLRGVAALSVLAAHIECLQHLQGPFARSHLAVDFFFVLSGFVIGHAYEQKLSSGRLSLSGFAYARWLRLYPLMAVGCLIGLVSTAVKPISAPLFFALLGQLTFWPILSGDTWMYLLNPVQWSLLFEGLANAGHAISLKWLSTRIVAGLALLGFVLLAISQLRHQSFDAGFNASTFKREIARVLYGYSAGLLLFRLTSSGRLPVVKAPFWLVAAALLAAMIGCAYGSAFQFAELVTVAVFPLIVWAGVGSAPEGWERQIADWLGRSSYPLYAVHYPLLVIWSAFAPKTTWPMAPLLAAFFLLALALDPADAWIRRSILAFRSSQRALEPSRSSPNSSQSTSSR